MDEIISTVAGWKEPSKEKIIVYQPRKWKAVYIDKVKTQYRINQFGEIMDGFGKYVFPEHKDRYGNDLVILRHMGKEHRITLNELKEDYKNRS